MNKPMELVRWTLWNTDEDHILEALEVYNERSADVVQGYTEDWAQDYVDDAIHCRRAAAENVLSVLIPIVKENTWQKDAIYPTPRATVGSLSINMDESISVPSSDTRVDGAPKSPIITHLNDGVSLFLQWLVALLLIIWRQTHPSSRE